MLLISAFVLCLSLGVGYGTNCIDIYGTWQNQLGSNMTVIPDSRSQVYGANRITGLYNTAVETKKNAALVTSSISGLYKPVPDGAGLLSFTVLFNHGKSLASWVGQCMVCDGEEILFTSWVLRSSTLKPSDKWMANLVGQDTFRRVRDNSIETLMRTQVLSTKDIKENICEKNLKVGVNGKWLSTSGDSLKFDDCFYTGVFLGMNKGIPILGQKDGGGPFTALGFASMEDAFPSESKSIKGWTGHIYESSLERSRTIETSWLSHTYSSSCKDPRASVKYGMDDYAFAYGYRDTVYESDRSWTQVATNYLMSFFS